MRILAIETSCDETAIAIIEAQKTGSKTKFKILGNDLSSQIALHTQFGGVFPMMAKREHGKNIINILEKVLKEAKIYKLNKSALYDEKIKNKIENILDRESELKELWPTIIPFIVKPKIDAIAVTTGPGLEPALWVGISFAKALGLYWNIPIIPVNHMEGHIFSIFPKNKKTFVVDSDKKIFPMISLLVSGGHTELIFVKDFMKYKKIGQTRDDAAGEAFDKVARMLGLPYPGGPEISKLAEKERENSALGRLGSATARARGIFHQKNIRASQNTISSDIILPRPMINSKDYDFSFSGLKTAVLYLIRDMEKEHSNILENVGIKEMIAREFEDAVIETLVSKTVKAVKEYKAKTLIIGGGVSANKYLQEIMTQKIKENKLKTKVHFPSKSLTGDNALMIAIAGFFQFKKKNSRLPLKANGNMSL
jgi:N6-L-threonylcarbamoyladenine synthase